MAILKALRTIFESNYTAFFVVNAAFLFALLTFVPLDLLITSLNGVFVGTMLAISVAYGGLFWDAFWNEKRFGKPLDADVRQFAIAFLGGWFAYGLTVYGSVYVRASDLPAAALTTTVIGRYVAIVAAVAQITAPNYGRGMWYGRDNKFLWPAMVIGLAAAILVFVLQETQALALEDLTRWHG